MNNLQRDFLEQSVANLENLVGQLKRENDARGFSETLARECFRTLHTLKGTSQTFGYAAASRLAHALENLLAAAKNQSTRQILSDEAYKSLFLEGLGFLKETFKRADFEIPAEFLKRIDSDFPRENKSSEPPTNAGEIPDEIFSRLTNAEKAALDSARQNKKDVFCLEIYFDLTSFADEFAAFRRTLAERCEIIATFPALESKDERADKIGFRILAATGENIEEIIEKNHGEIVFQSAPSSFSNDLSGVFAQIAAHGKALAERLDKRVRFKIAAEEKEQPAPELRKIIFDALLHLVRNAVDHALETSAERSASGKPAHGSIKIGFASDENNFYLSLADDGRGIDPERIKSKAIEKNLISSGADLPEQAALDLIFLPEFSTRDSLTEISGRGVGLDAVKNAVEKIGGKITVKSRKRRGATFEIVLPRST